MTMENTWMTSTCSHYNLHLKSIYGLHVWLPKGTPQKFSYCQMMPLSGFVYIPRNCIVDHSFPQLLSGNLIWLLTSAIYSGLSHWKWWFLKVFLVYQRVYLACHVDVTWLKGWNHQGSTPFHQAALGRLPAHGRKFECFLAPFRKGKADTKPPAFLVVLDRVHAHVCKVYVYVLRKYNLCTYIYIYIYTYIGSRLGFPGAFRNPQSWQ